jgi:Rrf2 family iron-sulfur cluster assembly transcriptional regulator
MRLSTKGRQAVAAMIDVALHRQQGPLSLAVLSQRQRISLSYLEQMFTHLRRHGLVSSTRGPGGGYSLGRSAQDITAADILYAVGALESAAAPPPPASQRGPDVLQCTAPELWASLSQKVVEFLDAVSLQQLVDDQMAQGVQLHAEPARAVKKPLPGPVKPLLPKAPNSVFQLGQMAGV